MLRIGILGSGFMGQTHAAAISRVPELRVSAVACGSRAQRLAAQYSASYESSASSLISRPDVDAVVIATPHFAHTQDALSAIDAGKPVLIEKPMATTLEDCHAILDASRRTGVPIAVGYHQRFRRTVREARKLIATGRIGEILTVQISMPMFWPETVNAVGDHWEWWRDPRSVGHILNSGPHAVDLLRWFLSSEVREVAAFCQPGPLPGEPERTTMALLRMERGALASLYSSNMLPCAPFPGEEFRLRIVGAEGLIDLNPYGELRISSADGWRVVDRQRPIDQESDAAFGDVRVQAYRDQIQAFALRIKGEPSDCGDGRDGEAGVSVCLAMLASSKMKSLIAITGDGFRHG
ncbi:MAG TPA: Gfo/Idh/MocA family oxidoreductase [Acidobacteriaceae bacterium]|nr:Gfo/Idh/MocA family oxidoreductase [Acidobacteriaceae bacterium]